MYSDNLKKIRRFLRDPDSKIFEDPFLLNLWNYGQADLHRATDFDMEIAVLRVPPNHQMSVSHDWEWTFAEHEKGHPFKFSIDSHQSPMAISHVWEEQALSLSTGEDSAPGDRYTHPWEAYNITTPADMPPNWFPYDHYKTVFMAYDDSPVEFKPLKQIQYDNPSWKTYTGEPYCHTVVDEVSKEFYLFPRPAASRDYVFGDLEDGMVVAGQVEENYDYFNYYYLTFTFGAATTDYGSVLDDPHAETTQTPGVAVDVLRTSGNILLIYRKKPTDVDAKSDNPGFPRYLQKYVEYDVLANAYDANTDGRIATLADYWSWRRDIGRSVLDQYYHNRMADRNYCLSGGARDNTRRRHPSLPSTYPAVYP
jgi:hypothetical protein